MQEVNSTLCMCMCVCVCICDFSGVGVMVKFLEEHVSVP